ncbi:MAG: biotin--[acetyl-CoA-carboxylase] ligase [Gudongella sp.]|jgi:BirA family biotin operon repressor/biotin-[acetyl-CoA-carboxylase] ligase|nr:biotin--[acetyl-CoA-carboxylase] ligase [Gudongella sp.]
MKDKIIERLYLEKGFVSGEAISNEYGLSRTAIWKHVKALREDGYKIESRTKKGYRLVETPDNIEFNEMQEDLQTSIIGKEIFYYDSLESTNTKAKEIAFQTKEGALVVADEQTAGKGRLGRIWTSPKSKGIYMSVILKPDIDPVNVARLTLLGAAAINLAFADIGIESEIKWPNDVVINGKKVAGVLTEMNSELGIINYIVLGAGININVNLEEIPEDLKERATSLKIVKGEEIDRRELFIRLVSRIDELYTEFLTTGDIDRAIQICIDNSAVIGKEIVVYQGKEKRCGRAIEINKKGELLVQFDTGVENLFSGEISIRGKHGYI